MSHHMYTYSQTQPPSKEAVAQVTGSGIASEGPGAPNIHDIREQSVRVKVDYNAEASSYGIVYNFKPRDSKVFKGPFAVESEESDFFVEGLIPEGKYVFNAYWRFNPAQRSEMGPPSPFKTRGKRRESA